MSTPTVAERIDLLIGIVEEAERRIFDGQAIQIVELETHVTDLCRDVINLPPNQADPLKERMVSLLETVERLENDLNMQHDALSERLQPRETRVNPLMAQEVDDEND